MSTQLHTELEENGIIVLPHLVSQDQLRRMQKAFGVRLRRMRWNDVDGYVKTEPSRHFVSDLLTVDQAFLEVALDPALKELVRGYIGTSFGLVEAKGWMSVPTRLDFHGWHNDSWYDPGSVPDIPRELKLGVYLTDVRSGAFNYFRGTHRKYVAKRNSYWKDVTGYPANSLMEVVGPAGTAFLFDTSGIHRQSMPILEPRWALFLAYHDPDVPLLQEDLDYYRYHPLLLNAAFLGNLTEEDHRILGFGSKVSYREAFDHRIENPRFERVIRTTFDVRLRAADVTFRIATKVSRNLRQVFRRPGKAH